MVPSTRSTSKSPDSVTHNTFLVPESSLLPTTSVGNYTNSHSNTPTFGISHTDANLDNSEGPKAVTNAIFNSDPRVETYPEPSAPKYEVRLFGLSQAGMFFHLNTYIFADGVHSQWRRMRCGAVLDGLASDLRQSLVERRNTASRYNADIDH